MLFLLTRRLLPITTFISIAGYHNIYDKEQHSIYHSALWTGQRFCVNSFTYIFSKSPLLFNEAGVANQNSSLLLYGKLLANWADCAGKTAFLYRLKKSP
jgi:hypothetical protein